MVREDVTLCEYLLTGLNEEKGQREGELNEYVVSSAGRREY